MVHPRAIGEGFSFTTISLVARVCSATPPGHSAPTTMVTSYTPVDPMPLLSARNWPPRRTQLEDGWNRSTVSPFRNLTYVPSAFLSLNRNAVGWGEP